MAALLLPGPHAIVAHSRVAPLRVPNCAGERRHRLTLPWPEFRAARLAVANGTGACDDKCGAREDGAMLSDAVPFAINTFPFWAATCFVTLVTGKRRHRPVLPLANNRSRRVRVGHSASRTH